MSYPRLALRRAIPKSIGPNTHQVEQIFLQAQSEAAVSQIPLDCLFSFLNHRCEETVKSILQKWVILMLLSSKKKMISYLAPKYCVGLKKDKTLPFSPCLSVTAWAKRKSTPPCSSFGSAESPTKKLSAILNGCRLLR